MSLAVLSIYILGLKPKWYCCDVMLPSDLLNKHTAFSVSTQSLEIWLCWDQTVPVSASLLISPAICIVLFSSSKCEKTVTTSTLIQLMLKNEPILVSRPHPHNYTACQECNPIAPYMVKTVNSKVKVNLKVSNHEKEQTFGQRWHKHLIDLCK